MDEARQASDGLGLFVRSLVGLDRTAAVEAFAGFTSTRNLSANQLHFVQLMIEHLTQNGVMEAARLYEPPLVDIAPLGPESLFEMAEVDDLIEVLHAIRRTAAPEHSVA